jgi:antitoxin (DNA-binding transcriptional repressor) of toxin-antitoxin stability system
MFVRIGPDCLWYNRDEEAAMTKTIDVATTHTPLSELVSLALTGAEVILAEGGTPLVRLVPVAPISSQRIAGLHEGVIWTSEDFDAPLPEM